MKVVVNERLIASRGRLGKIASLTGLAVLLAGFGFSFFPRYFYVSLLCLFLGPVFSNKGTYNLNRWVKRPRSDEVIARALKGLDDRFWLFSYVLPAEHVVLGPTGLFVIKAKPHDGDIMCEGSRWRRKFRWSYLLRIFYEESLGNPTAEVAWEAERLRKFLAQKLPEDAQVEVKEVILFTSPAARLELHSPLTPVLTAKTLKNHIRQKGAELIPQETYQKVLEVFRQHAEEIGAA